MHAAVLTVGVRGIHLTCGCCHDRVRLSVRDSCEDFEDQLLQPALRWMGGHLAPRVCAVELLVNGVRQLLTEHDV